jgi:hypothetical protein
MKHLTDSDYGQDQLSAVHLGVWGGRFNNSSSFSSFELCHSFQQPKSTTRCFFTFVLSIFSKLSTYIVIYNSGKHQAAPCHTQSGVSTATAPVMLYIERVYLFLILH